MNTADNTTWNAERPASGAALLGPGAVLLRIAREELRYWRRSRLALAGLGLLGVLLLATSVLTALRMDDARHERLHQQREAEQAFLSQPDRHPHRMVHYGHYLFRSPPPLAMVDPGLDPVTGQSIFLEGHRRNSATFADAGASVDLGGLTALTPAVAWQVVAPLLLILLGHSTVVRERESATLAPLIAQGLPRGALLAGKGLALTAVVGVLLLPLLVLSGLAVVHGGERPMAAAAMVAAWGIYLLVWAALTLAASALLRDRRVLLAALAGLWLWSTLLVPGAAVNVSASLAPAPGKVAQDIALAAELRALGDGHDEADPGFARLRAELLERYGVSRVEDLPVNFRGIVAGYAEARQAAVMDRFAEARMAAQARQARVLQAAGWLSPSLAIAFASRAVAGTDLAAHHRFLREAEALRLDFVQGLNALHAEALTYADDVSRSRDAAAEQRTRVSADNWALLDTWRFEPAPAGQRLAHAAPSLLAVAAWLAGALLACVFAARRLSP